MPSELELAFHDEMVSLYRRAKEESGYNATRFLQMVSAQGGVEAARTLIRAGSVSDGYTALWERGRLDLTVEALVTDYAGFHSLFSEEERRVCAERLETYGYRR